MTNCTLYLFPDTNLFIQCRPLADLDWSEWKEFEEVHLIACRPVQREIDNQKNRVNDRVARRARATSEVFRRIIYSESGFELVRPTGPQVKLYLQGPSLPSEELKGTLDYSKVDDEIVGYLHKYRLEHPNDDARMLTYDTGPMMTAKSHEIPFIPIKEEWILPPEHNKAEREVARLKEELELLKKTEPSVQVKCLDDKDKEVDSLELECQVYEPLGEQDIDELIDYLRKRFPIAADSGSKEQNTRPASLEISAIGNAFRERAFHTPPSAEAIAFYTDFEYPDWIDTCRRILSNLHKALQRKVGQSRANFAIENSGTRPGKDTLVEFIAKGDFKLCPKQEDDEEFEEDEETKLNLPPPPKPPQGQSLQPLMSNRGTSVVPFSYSARFQPYLESTSVPQRDPNAFSFIPEFPQEPVDSIRLACDQWRHGWGEEIFTVEFCVNANSQEVVGQLECVVQAENISRPVRKVVRIKINVTKISTKDYAYEHISSHIGS